MTTLPTNYWFTPALREQLVELIKYPNETPNLLCFYGEPGTGKTSVARHIADVLAVDSRIFNMDHKQNLGNRFIDSERLWFEGNSLLTCIDAERPVSKVTILDEFHNLKHSEQDKFKTLFDAVPKNHWVIVCLNTAHNKTLRQTLSSAIYSRLHSIDFNIKENEVTPLAQMIVEEYSLLTEYEVKAWLPDFRKIQREGALRQKRKQRTLTSLSK
jgi:Cdc6-like AAA superfamily ATPase